MCAGQVVDWCHVGLGCGHGGGGGQGEEGCDKVVIVPVEGCSAPW